jgi:hypothetical protein
VVLKTVSEAIVGSVAAPDADNVVNAPVDGVVAPTVPFKLPDVDDKAVNAPVDGVVAPIEALLIVPPLIVAVVIVVELALNVVKEPAAGIVTPIEASFKLPCTLALSAS